MTGVTFVFEGGRPPVWRELPSVPDVGDHVMYDGVTYIVTNRVWFGTETTWAATLHLAPFTK